MLYVICITCMHMYSLHMYLNCFLHAEKQYMLLYEAVRHGNMESLLSALQYGLSEDCRDKFNKTPLMVAASHGRVDVARLLLDRG